MAINRTQLVVLLLQGSLDSASRLLKLQDDNSTGLDDQLARILHAASTAISDYFNGEEITVDISEKVVEEDEEEDEPPKKKK